MLRSLVGSEMCIRDRKNLVVKKLRLIGQNLQEGNFKTKVIERTNVIEEGRNEDKLDLITAIAIRDLLGLKIVQNDWWSILRSCQVSTKNIFYSKYNKA